MPTPPIIMDLKPMSALWRVRRVAANPGPGYEGGN